ncbi:hypothetical protein [Streptomyces sp. NPDC020742]|uniref:hypothetical protein n=1 Tax=Streptomyces sp. NPDC020742 TaxID=3154897 RepID=UPI0033D973C7
MGLPIPPHPPTAATPPPHTATTPLAPAPATPRPPAAAGLLDRLAAERVTGTLHGPHGRLYLLDGAVTCVEDAAAPGLGERLTAAGKVPPQGWRHAAQTAGPQRRGAQFLVSEGWLTQGELEVCHLAALLDAAFFALPLLPEAASFTPGTGHWLGVVRPISATALQQATARRRALLDRLHPWAAVDTSPVVPLCPGDPAPTLTARQRWLLARADGRQTPYQLARALGQSAYLTLLDIRRLAAAGLVRMPTAPAGLPRRRPGAGLEGQQRQEEQQDREGHQGPEGQRGREQRRPATPATTAAARPTPAWQPQVAELLDTRDPDIALLVRLRTALEENL